MPEPYFSSTRYPSALLQALFGPQPTAPASTTHVATPTFGQLLTSIQDMDSLVDPPSWPNNNQRTRALELARVLRDFGGYNQFHWQLTSGISNLPLRQRIAQKFPDYPNFYSENGLFRRIIIPGTDVKFDVPHFNAALSRYLDCGLCVLPEDWASWAGDMFTFADRLDSTFSKSNIGLDSIQSFANSTLGSPKVPTSTFKNNFADEDFYADIDARNISTLIHHGQSYHDAMDNYYNNQLYGRFGHFIDSYGGWKNFEKHVNSFDFFPLTPNVNAIFVEAAKRAFLNKIREGCLNELGCYIP